MKILKSLGQRLFNRSMALSIFSGAIMLMVFPNFNFWPLAFVALLPLLVAIEAKHPSEAFRLGLWMGLIYFGGSLNWLEYTMVHFGGMPVFLAWPVVFLLAAYLALYPAIVCWLLARTANSGWSAGIRLPVFWVALEGVRGIALTGFPWNYLGHGLYGCLPLMQMADLAGVLGLSFYLAACNGLAYEAMQQPYRKRALLAMGCLILFGLGYGSYRLSTPLPENTVRLALIQHNAPQELKWDPLYKQEIVQTLLDLTEKILPQKPDLVVWPEAAVPFRFSNSTTYRRLVGDFIRTGKTTLLLGSPEKDPEQDRYYNSAFYIDATGDIQNHYRKMQLVPFGEYIPFQKILFFVEKMANVGGNFYAGETFTVFDLNGISFSAFICFESAFGEIVYPFARRGAQFLVTITNDSWFGETSGTTQHRNFLPFRAIETRRPIAQAAQSGYSAAYDQQGHLLASTSLMVKDTLVVDIHPASKETWTLYMLSGESLRFLCWILTALMAYKKPTST